MSAIAAIYNVPSTRDELNEWSFAHAAHHADIIRRIREIVPGTKLDSYVLDPFDPKEPGVWLYQHQTMHQQFEPILGIQGFDLLDADFSSQDNFAGWVWLNDQTHFQAADILGIG